MDARAELSAAREARRDADAAEVRVLRAALAWAVANPPMQAGDAAVERVAGPTGSRAVEVPLSAAGVPEVDRAAVAELGLALGCSTQAAQCLVGDVLELAHRLPLLWARVLDHEVVAWRARRVAQATRLLPVAGTAYVDRQVAPVAHRLGGAQLDRLVETALARFDPTTAHRLAEERRETRHVEIDLDSTTLSGLTPVTGRIDLPDALDLEAALAHAAEQLAAWGSADSIDVRRARALGDLARQHLAWHGEQTPPMPIGTTTLAHRGEPTQPAGSSADSADAAGEGGPRWRVPPRRQVVLYVHLDRSALDPTNACDSGGLAVGRVENTGTPVTADTIRDWCGEGATRLSVRPVLDLDQPQRADTYQVPDRIREQVRLRDGTCVFPGCHAPGLRCQHDHIDPYDHDHPDTGGQTETTNLALLCQRHHTLKTHHGFTYTLLTSGTVLWRTPHGLRIHRHPDGTTHIDGLPDTDPTRLHGAAADDPGAATPSTRANVDTDTAEVCDPPDP